MTDEENGPDRADRKGADADLIRDMLAFAAERLMSLEVEALTGARPACAAPGVSPTATATASAPGTPGPAGSIWPSQARKGSYFPVFL